MNSSQDEFVSNQQEIIIQNITLSPPKNTITSLRQKQNCKKQQISLKFNRLPKPINYKPQKTYTFIPNISFDEEKCYRVSKQQIKKNNQNNGLIDSFCGNYNIHNEVYRKGFNFGSKKISNQWYFASIFVPPSKIQSQKPCYFYKGNNVQTDIVDINKHCTFDSEFESGNLYAVYQINANEYDLIVQNDINSKGNTQWFYFRLNNPPKDTNIKLNLVNFRKKNSLFNFGMKPCIFSSKAWKQSKKGWYRDGADISYYENQTELQYQNGNYYTLTFTISTKYQNDVLRIAYSFPYTFSDLNDFLIQQQKIKYKKQLFEKQIIGMTIGNHPIYALTIQQSNKNKNKPFVIILARQHPGQTPSSYVCEGFLNFLLSKDRQSQFLRQRFQFIIIPMANPDGVACGNYRSNLFGFDMNRKWSGSKSNSNQITIIKNYLNDKIKNKKLAFAIDLHGHSRKMFSFFYGNPSNNNPINSRIFPFLCSKIGFPFIRFEDCTFSYDHQKRNTARIKFNTQFYAQNSFTFQVSFFGYYNHKRQKVHFTIDDLKQLGHILGKSLFLYEKGKQHEQIHNEKKKEIKTTFQKCLLQLKNNENLMRLGEIKDEGSSSNPSECQLTQQILQEQTQRSCRTSKMVKKKIKSQSNRFTIIKQDKQQINKSKYMQVMNITQVQSRFPSKILALLPMNYKTLSRFIKKIDVATQTQKINYHKQIQFLRQQQIKLMYHRKKSLNKQCKSNQNIKIKNDHKKLFKERLMSHYFNNNKDRPLNSTTIEQNMNKSVRFQTIEERQHFQISNCQVSIQVNSLNFQHFKQISNLSQRKGLQFQYKSIDQQNKARMQCLTSKSLVRTIHSFKKVQNNLFIKGNYYK